MRPVWFRPMISDRLHRVTVLSLLWIGLWNSYSAIPVAMPSDSFRTGAGIRKSAGWNCRSPGHAGDDDKASVGYLAEELDTDKAYLHLIIIILEVIHRVGQ